MSLPKLEGTYDTGTTLQLHHWPPPALTEDKWFSYKGAPRMDKIANRYSRSIAERVTLPPSSSSDGVSITLENRLNCSTCRISHVWTARVQDTSLKSTYPPLVVVKIYDPTFLEDGEAYYADPFAMRNSFVSHEVEAYHRLKCLQGTALPHFYGHFLASLPHQHNRTINAILMEYVEGIDFRLLVPRESAEFVCSAHKEAVIDAALHLYFDLYALGVEHMDMQPRNVILRPASPMQYCTTLECPLRLKADCKDLNMVMVDFEVVELREPDPSLNEPSTRREDIEYLKVTYLKKWLEGTMP